MFNNLVQEETPTKIYFPNTPNGSWEIVKSDLHTLISPSQSRQRQLADC